MVRLELTSDKIPDDIITKAKQLGDSVLARQDYKECRAYQAPGGFYYLEAIRYDDLVRVKVLLFTGTFVLHPRTGQFKYLPYYVYSRDEFGFVTQTREYMAGVVGGWKDGTIPLDTEYIFPMADDDRASFIVLNEEGVYSGEFGGLYGNLYWTDNDLTDPVVLSWKGTPTRHFRLPSNTELPGISLVDFVQKSSIEDLNQYTTFSNNLYKDGELLLAAPADNFILGSCINKESGKIYIVTQYATSTNFYLALWIEGGETDGWTKRWETIHSRDGLPWFANNAGSEFICSNGEKLVIQTTALTPATTTAGTYSETGTSYTTFDAKYSGTKFNEFKDNISISSTVAMSFNATSGGSSVADKYGNTTITIPIVEEDPPALTQLTVVGPAVVDGNMPEYTGNLADYNPSGGSVGGGTITKKAPTGCGTGNVEITVTCPDGSGSETATLAVRIAGGSWSVDSDVTYSDGGLGTYVVNATATTRTEEWISYGCKARASVSGSYDICVYFFGLGGCYPVTIITGYSCDGPQFSLTAPAALQALIDASSATCVTTSGNVAACNSPAGSPPGCSPSGWNSAYTSIDQPNIFCNAVTRRRISTYVCP